MLSILRTYVNKQHLNAWAPVISGVRNALYPATHLDPIPDKEQLKLLEEEGKLDALKAIPVKPAPIDMTNSLYDDALVKKFINMVMQWSNKTLARELVYETFAKIKRIQLRKYYAAPEEAKASIACNPSEIFAKAIENCKPVLQLVPVKKGGITYQVPMPITANRSRFMAMKWLIMAARDKEGQISFVDQLTKELLDAFNNEGRVVKRKQDLHKICENNKAYAHYRWQ